MKAVGRVSLVGAGPGDPELITVRGRGRLEEADVVIYDELAGRALLDYCRPDCELIYAGKRCGRNGITQERIIELLVARAANGGRVVRLKGGDPFIFGRGGEELAAMLRAGIPCEVVPGVTAAVAAGAAAGVPLTHRQFSSAVVFLTGHENPAKPELAVDWAAYARLGATLCIYMGGHHLATIAGRLLAGGMAADTPVAIVSRATLPGQKVEFRTLADEFQTHDDGIASPALVIVGEVARFPSQACELAAAAAIGVGM